MVQRCTNHNVGQFADYGGRGITVCERWKSFENFLADMGRRPSASHSIDRTDNTRGYGPDNCRWATKLEQANNKRNNVTIEFNGRSQTVPQWAKELGIAATTLYTRLYAGWPIERALTRKSRKTA
jgi:hypothetical protein